MKNAFNIDNYRQNEILFLHNFAFRVILGVQLSDKLVDYFLIYVPQNAGQRFSGALEL